VSDPIAPVDPIEPFRDVAAGHPRCFWLDGGGARQWSGRRSLLGWLEDDDLSLTYDARAGLVRRHAGGRAEVVGDDIFDVLSRELALGRPDDQWFGYLGYACRPDLPAATGSAVPDAIWMRARHVRLFRHEPVGESLRLSAVATPDKRRSTRFTGYPPPAYATAFHQVQEHLHAGNSYEVNLTYRSRTPSDLDPATAYLRLRELNPAPYAGFLQHDLPGARGWLLSSSPERFALITEDRTLETKPIKGTTPRGTSEQQDEELRSHLASDPKFRAENLMIVDLLRNDLSMVCEPGTVEVPALMEVESYAAVHQLVSTVRGRLRDGVSTVDALRALFPAGSMTGAPKLRTMQIIEDVEESPRGPYAGAFGQISADGRADLGVVIRSLTTAGDGTYELGTGGGITVRSDVDEEYAESRWKAERLLRVFDQV
jgi:para-aminobenzoate synthetase